MSSGFEDLRVLESPTRSGVDSGCVSHLSHRLPPYWPPLLARGDFIRVELTTQTCLDQWGNSNYVVVEITSLSVYVNK